MGDKEDKLGVTGEISAHCVYLFQTFLKIQLPPETITRVSSAVMSSEWRPEAGDVTDIIQIRGGGTSEIVTGHQPMKGVRCQDSEMTMNVILCAPLYRTAQRQ